jgi:hypothetical protein
VATVVATSTASTGSAYSSQRKVDRTQTNNVLWSMFWDGSSTTGTSMDFYYSTDNGATWAKGGEFGFAGTGTTYTPNGSMFIDLDDFCHVVYKDRHDGYVLYRRGTPNAARTAWTWSAARTIWSATTSGDYPDVVAHREGTGWRVHIVFSRHDSTSDDRVYYGYVNLDSSGTVTASGASSLAGPYGNTVAKWPSIDFKHTGDGKTVAGGTPHLYAAWSAGATGAGKGIRFKKATYSSGSWTWGTEREIDSTRRLVGDTYSMQCMFDGTRVVLAAPHITKGDGTDDVVLYERDAADTTTTTRVLIAAPATNELLLWGSSTYDASGNVYLFGTNYDEAAGSRDLVYRKWTRSGASLGAEVVIDAGVGSPYVSAKRGYSNSLAEFIYTDGTASPYSVTYDAITLNTAPNAPILTAPADGATIDRNITQRFDWDFSDPDSGDSQSKYDLRYRVTGTSTWTDVTGTTPNTYHDFAAGTFAAGDYEWQVRTYDAAGAVGPYSASSFFTAADAPPEPTITDPVSGATISNIHTVQWSTPNQDAYQQRRVADNAGAADTSTVYADTGEVVSATARARTVEFETNNRYEHIQVRIKHNGLWSSWASIRVHVSYTPPATPTLTFTADDAAGSLLVNIDNGAWPVSVTTPTFTGTGTGTMTGPTATAGVTDSHSWTATLVTAAADGGTFDVAVDETVVGQATVGTEFTYEGLSFTINDGATDYAVGDQFTWSTTATKTNHNDVYVTDPGKTEERRAINVTPNGSWRYWTPASGVDYSTRTRVVAVADNGVTAST